MKKYRVELDNGCSYGNIEYTVYAHNKQSVMLAYDKGLLPFSTVSRLVSVSQVKGRFKPDYIVYANVVCETDCFT